MLFTKKAIGLNDHYAILILCEPRYVTSTNPLLFILDFVLLWKFLQFMSLANLILTGDAYEISYLANISMESKNSK
jgi:hypothetical protein